jgi:hypothetical protein
MPRVGRVDSVANLLIESPVCEGLGAEFLPVDQSSSHRVRCDLELAQVRSSGIVDASDAIDAERPEYASKTGSAVMTVVVNPSVSRAERKCTGGAEQNCTTERRRICVEIRGA